MAGSGWQVVPSGQGVGADIVGIDLREPLSRDDARGLKAAWHEHLVLRFRGQRLSDDELVARTRELGEPDKIPALSASKRVPGAAGDYVLTISNVIENGETIGELGDGEARWHQDMTYVESPPVGALLFSLEVPESGGDTQFCDLYQAYEKLPAAVRERIDGLTCIHDITLDSSGKPRKGHTPTTDPTQAKGPAHPLVRQHPHSGRKHLFLGRRPFAYIPGLPLAESEALLDVLWAQLQDPSHIYTQQWQVGDLILWDNRSTAHRRDAFDGRARRIMHRTQLRND